MKKEKKNKQSYDKPISLYPLKPEEALNLFMRINPKKFKDDTENGLPSR